MGDSSLLAKLKAHAEAGPRHNDGPANGTGDDSYEEPAGDGRSSPHPTFAVQLVQANRDALAVTYASIHSPLKYDPSRGVVFRFESAEGLFEAHVEGNNLDRLFDKLCAGKREVVRVNGSTVLNITVRAVPQAKG